MQLLPAAVLAASALVSPQLTGPFPVGTFDAHLTDSTRADPFQPAKNRELMVTVSYPAHPRGQRAAWLGQDLATAIDPIISSPAYLGIPAGTVDWSGTRRQARVDAAPIRNRWPVVLVGATGSERAVALETLGLARVKKGDAAGIDDVRQAIAERRKAGLSYSLGLINLGTAYATLGDARARKAVRAEARVAALRHGDEFSLSFLDSSRYVELFWEGRYDEALENLDEAIGNAPSQPYFYSIRSRIRLLTGDLGGARADAAIALDTARMKGHPGELQHPLVLRARIALRDGEPAEVAELLTLLSGQQITGPIGVNLPIVLAAAGRGPESLAGVSWSRWKDAAVAYLHGNREEAFRTYQEIGSVPDALEAR